MEISDESGDRLRAVFDLCDTKNRNFISVQHFTELAKEHFGAGDGSGLEVGLQSIEIEKIVSLLDPDGNGKIHFKQFCQGVQQIRQLKSPASASSHEHIFADQCSNGQQDYVGLPEEDTNSLEPHDISELGTYNEYDMTDDDLSMLSTHTDQKHSRSSSGCNWQHAAMYTEDDHDSAISSRSTDFQDQDRRVEELRSEGEELDKFDYFGRPSLRYSSRSLGHRKSPSSALADHLISSGIVDPAHSCCSDDIFDDIDGSFNELNNKVICLESQIQELTDNQKRNDEKHMQLKKENSQLVERVHILEEQLRDVDSKSHQLLMDEQKRNHDSLNYINKDKTAEIELLTHSLRHMENDYEMLKEEVPRLMVQNERLSKEKVRLEDNLCTCEKRLSSLLDSHEALRLSVVEERSNGEQERLINAQLLDELTKELDELRTYQTHTQAHMMSRDVSRGRQREYSTQISHLKQEVTRLRDHNDDLQSQLLSCHVQGGRQLLQSGAGVSLSHELTDLPKDELVTALSECREVSHKLREYLDRITLRILETNPTLLEIGDRGKTS